MPTNPNDSAWPLPNDSRSLNKKGLTKREYIATAAMQGLLAGLAHGYNEIEIAEDAVSMADRLIAKLNKPSEETDDKDSSQN